MSADKDARDLADSIGNNSPDAAGNDQEVRARKAAADSLRRQIQKLKEGRPPKSLNEFVERQMAEDKKGPDSSRE